MIRTQISLDEDQYAEVRRRARAHGLSMAGYIRRALDSALADDDRAARVERALSVVGMFEGTGEPVSRDHDRYLDEAYADH
ncbi:MAG: CopG family transcriptional regulator [Candidatus Limnocylindria bacterium]